MNPWLILFTLPVLFQGWLLGLLSLTFGIAKSPKVKRGVLQLTWRDWIANRWRYSTTLGACMWMHPQHGGTTEYHEFIHVQQYEDECMKAAWVLGIVAFWEWKLALILYAFSAAPCGSSPTSSVAWLGTETPTMAAPTSDLPTQRQLLKPLGTGGP